MTSNSLDESFPLTENSQGKAIIYEKEVSGYRTKVVMWSETSRTLQVSVYDHSCWMRFMHIFAEGADIEQVFIDIMARVKAIQIEYAGREHELLLQLKGKLHVN